MCGQQTEATFVDLVSSAPNPFPECTVELEYPYGERMRNYAQVTGQISLFTDSNLRRPIPSPSENPYRWSPKLQQGSRHRRQPEVVFIQRCSIDFCLSLEDRKSVV